MSAAFDGGRITSDGGVMLLAQAELRLGIAERLAAVIPDGRDADRVVHLLPDILRARIFGIACGYEDADDLDRLRSIRRSNSPVAAYPIPAGTCARNRPFLAGRTRRPCAI